MPDSSSNDAQLDRFKEAACKLEADDDEAKFNAALKKVAKAKPSAKAAPDADHGR